MRNNTHQRLGAALAVLAAWALARPAGAGVFVEVSVADKQNGRYRQQVSVKPGEKLFFRISALNTYGRPLVAVCDIPMLKYQEKELLLPGQMASMTLTAKCTQQGTFKPAVCLEFVDPATGGVSEVDDSCLVLCAKPGDGGSYEIGGGQQSSGLEKGSGQQQIGGQQTGDPQLGGGQQQGSSEPAFLLLGSQHQSGQQQGDSGSLASGQQGDAKNHGQDKKGNSGAKNHGKKGKHGDD